MNQSGQWNTDNTALMVAGAAVALSIISFKVIWKEAKKMPWPKVEGALPFIGNTHQLGGASNLKNTLHEWALKYSKETGVFEANIAGRRIVVVCREDLAKEIMLNRPYKVIRRRKVRAVTISLGADGVVTSEGKKWKMERRLIAPAFNHTNIKDYMKSIKLMVRRLVDKWGSLGANGNPVVVNKDATWFTLDTISLTALGRDFDSLRAPNPESEGILRLFKLFPIRFLSPIPYWHIPIIGNYLDGAGFYTKRIVGGINKLIDNYRSGWVDSSPANTGHPSEKEEEEYYQSAGDTLVKKVVSQSLKDKTFDQKRIIENLTTIFLAGIDTTASTLLSTMYMLAMDETGLQEELAKEADMLPPLDDLTLDDLVSRIPRFRSFLYEIHRFHGSLPVIGLSLTEDIPFCGTTLTKDMDIYILSQFITKNPYSPPSKIPLGPNGEKATEFCARRFLVKDDSSKGAVSVDLPGKNSTSFLAFGHGVRRCLGEQFANAEVSTVMVELIRNFKMSLAPDHEPIRRIMGLSEIPDKDVRIVFSSRTN